MDKIENIERVIIRVGEVLLPTTWQQDTCISEFTAAVFEQSRPCPLNLWHHSSQATLPRPIDCRHVHVGVSSRNPSYLDGPMPFDVPLAH